MVSRALIICTQIRPGRTRSPSRQIVQPIAGLNVAAQLDPARFDVTLYDEDRHGPYEPARANGAADVVFLTGSQADFDRMRQMSYVFRRAGAVVVAVGAICSRFPEFAATFFDVVCAGGIEAARAIADDCASGRQLRPIYRAPSLRFTDNRAQILAALDLLAPKRRVRGWWARVTPNILSDQALMARMAAAKCRQLIVGIERFGDEALRRWRADIANAERAGITIGYGLVFDPRHQTAAVMEEALRTVARTPGLEMPRFVSLACPLAGADAFWEDAAAGRLAPDLRLRDLDGEAIAYSTLADRPDVFAQTIARLHPRPSAIAAKLSILRKTFARTRNMAADSGLDPRYVAHPPDISAVDFARYFAPIQLTGADGRPLPWLAAYAPKAGAPTRGMAAASLPAASLSVMAEPVG